MIPIGYMYKTVSPKPAWLETDQVIDIFSVSSCISKDFASWINYWKHNGYWFFDDPAIIESLAQEYSISLEGMTLFFYKAFEKQWDDNLQEWVAFEPEKSFQTNVRVPVDSKIEGYDIVSFYSQTSAECSPLSCNHMAEEISVNPHCLLPSLAEAKQLIESGTLKDCEPGPYRVFEVHTVIKA